MGAARYRLWFLAAGGTLIDGFSIFTLGVALPLIASDLHLGSVTMGLVGAALVLGAAVGALLGGSAADRFGRKAAFLVDMGILAARRSDRAPSPAIRPCSCWASFWSGWALASISLASGSYVSGNHTEERAQPNGRRDHRAAVARHARRRRRGDRIARSARSIRRCGGSSSRRPAWSPSLFLALRLSLPESPRWLIEHGRADEVAAIVERLAPIVCQVLRVQVRGRAGRGAATVVPTPAVPTAAAKRTGFALLFSREYRARTLLVSVPWFLMDIAHLRRRPVHARHPRRHALRRRCVRIGRRRLRRCQGAAASIDVFLLVGFLVGLWAVPRFGRIHMQVLGFARA